MKDIRCYRMDCVFNRKIRKDVGICKRETIAISELMYCLDYFKNPKENQQYE